MQDEEPPRNKILAPYLAATQNPEETDYSTNH